VLIGYRQRFRCPYQHKAVSRSTNLNGFLINLHFFCKVLQLLGRSETVRQRVFRGAEVTFGQKMKSGYPWSSPNVRAWVAMPYIGIQAAAVLDENLLPGFRLAVELSPCSHNLPFISSLIFCATCERSNHFHAPHQKNLLLDRVDHGKTACESRRNDR
jgi:hypothetical protein